MADNTNFHNILIVRTDRIGDVVLTTPAIKAIRLAYPTARISILVSPATYELILGNPYVDDILVDERNGRHKGFWGFLRLQQEISIKKFDLAIIFHTKRRYNWLCFVAGIPVRLGYKNNKYGFLLNRPVRDPRAKGEKHEAEYCLDVLKTIGVDSGVLEMLVPLHNKSEIWAQEWMHEQGVKNNEFITIHPGASDQTKCWPNANFTQLTDSLIERYALKVLIIGSSQTIAAAEHIERNIRHGSQCINLAGKTTLSQTVSLLRRARVLISNDSGPVHVAAGVGCPVISLFLRNQPGINAQRWKPLGDKGYILVNKPGEEIKLDEAGKPVSGQSDSIKVDDVLELLEKIFQKGGQYEIF